MQKSQPISILVRNRVGMDKNNRVSLLALIVALLALVIALGQLIQQIFGTADGYRRCQSSTIGSWAKYTKLRSR